MVQTIKDLNAQVIEGRYLILSLFCSFYLRDDAQYFVLPETDPSLTKNIGCLSIQSGKVIGKFSRHSVPSIIFLLD